MESYFNFLQEADRKVGEYNEKIIKSVVTTIVQGGNVDPLKYDTGHTFDYEYMRSLPSYSRYNPFVWMRIYSRKIEVLKQEDQEYRRYFIDLSNELKDIQKELSGIRLKRLERIRFNGIEVLRYKIKKVLDCKLYTCRLVEPLQIAFYGDWKMSKNNFLSLLTLNHDLRYWDGTPNKTMTYIARLPDEIGYETFEEVVFINRLEHDDDCYLFDMIMDGMQRTLKKNRELREKMFEKAQECFGPVPTYTVTTNELGDITAVTPNRPKLRTVK